MNGSKIILVTRFLRSGSAIRQWADQNQYQLIEKPFIKTVAVTGLIIPPTDWIFFSSPQGVQLYLDNYPVKAKKIAALSEGTALELEGNVILVHGLTAIGIQHTVVVAHP